MKASHLHRAVSVLAASLMLAGCGASMFDGPPADMTVMPPPGAAPARGHHRHHDYHGESGTSYVDDAPMPMPPGAMGPGGMGGASDPGAPGGPGMGGSGPGTVSFGSGQSADITPHPATPDTEVSYGPNGGSHP